MTLLQCLLLVDLQRLCQGVSKMARCRLALLLLAGALLAASAEELVWGKSVSKGVCVCVCDTNAQGGGSDHLMHYVCNIAAWFRR